MIILIAIGAGLGLIFLGLVQNNSHLPTNTQAADLSSAPSIAKHSSTAAARDHKVPRDDMSSKSRAMEGHGAEPSILGLEDELERNGAIERLNADSLTISERIKLGQQLEMLDRLRAKEIEAELATIEHDVAYLKEILSAKLEAFRREYL